MLDNQIQIKTANFLFLVGFSVGFVGLFFSPFIASLGTGLIIGAALLSIKQLKYISWQTIVLYSLPLLFLLSDLFRPSGALIREDKLLLSFGFTGMALSCFIYGNRIKTQSKFLLILVLSTVVVVNLITVFNYFSNREEIDLLLRQSKAIPIAGGMHHIHFGVINAVCISFLLYLLLIRKSAHKLWLGALLAILVCCFHILSSRTGLVSFYSAFFISLVVYAIKQSKIVPAIIAIAVAVMVNFLAFQFSSSYQSKLANSIEDVNSWDKDVEVNYKSMGMRIEAYKVSLAIIKDRPLFGVGASQMDANMQDYYDKMDSKLFVENRVGPHNQFLEFGIKYGLFGMLWVLAFALFWLSRSVMPVDYALLIAVLVILFSMQFESLLERQVSIFITACFLPLIQMKSQEY